MQFHELGIRHATEKPVIHFAQYETQLPFDAMTHRAVIQDILSWEGTTRARRQIREAAKAIDAPDYRVSNPITQANASFRMLQSSDPAEHLLAELQIRVERLEVRDRTERIEARELLSDNLPDLASDVDRMLVAGYIVQSRSNDKSFSTGEANALLTEQGVSVGNPSQLVRQNLVAKRVFKHLGRYRISQTGVAHLNQLIGSAVT